LIYLLLSVMLILTLVELTYGNRKHTGNIWIDIDSWILDMADTVRTQILIGYYGSNENISRTKSAVKTSTRTKHTRIVSN